MTALRSAQASGHPPPDLQLHLIGDSDGVVDPCCRSGARRPSNVSLSRIRSCPQLAVLINNDQDSPSDMAPMTDDQGNILYMCPALRNHLCVDIAEPDSGGIRSTASTPTPPSTPISRRNYVISSSCISKSKTHSSEAVPPFAPLLHVQHKPNSVLETTNLSIDSRTEHLNGWVPLGNENLQHCDRCHVVNSGSSKDFHFHGLSQHQLDDENASDADDGSSTHTNERFPSPADHHHYHNDFHVALDDDSIEKCNRWLKGLRIRAVDKVKSRSHIQLSTT
ncbi:hypothetical protein BsWGS_02053 [Bradybaena similaris]